MGYTAAGVLPPFYIKNPKERECQEEKERLSNKREQSMAPLKLPQIHSEVDRYESQWPVGPASQHKCREELISILIAVISDAQFALLKTDCKVA